MTSFLKSVTQSLIERAGWEGLHEYTIVYPMHRAGLYLKQYIREQMQAEDVRIPVILPRMITIDELVDSYSEPGSSEEIRSVCMLYSCYRKHVADPMPLDAFYGWGVQLMSDFSNADMALMDVEKMMEYTSDAAQLDELAIDDDTRSRLLRLLGSEGEDRSVQRYFHALWQALPSIYRDFAEKQSEENVGTKGARYRWVIEHFQQIQPIISQRKYVFVGFNYLLRAEREIMRLLKPQSLYYFDYDKDFHLDDGVYQFIRENMVEFPAENVVSAASGRDEGDGAVSDRNKGNLTAIVCQSNEAQAQYVNKWLQEHYHPGETTGIIIADESMLEPVIYALPDGEQYSHANITKGYPLRNTPVYTETIRWMRAVKDVNAVNDRGTACGRDQSNEMFSTILQQLSQSLQEWHRAQERGEDESWQQVLADEAYYQTQTIVAQMRVLCEEGWLSEVKELRTLRNLLRRKLESVSIPFHGEPITDIQIMGVLETRLLDFDNLLILNVEEGVVPNTGTDKSFLPYDLRKAHRMQTKDEEAKIYAYNFFRLLRRAKHVTLTFSEAQTQMGKKTMSRFLMQILSSPGYQVKRVRLTESGVTGELPPFIPTFFDCKTLTPSSISAYIECPRKFYLRDMLGLQEAETDSVLLTMAEIGSLIHGCLQAIYTQPADNEDWNAAMDMAYQGLNDSYKKHNPNGTKVYLRSEHEIENEIVIRMAKGLKQMDKHWDSVEVREMEKGHYVTMQVERDSCTKTVSVGGKIDRLDVVTKGGKSILRVVDYKTGKYKQDKLQALSLEELFTDKEKAYMLQALIYCAVLTEKGNLQHPLMPELLFARHTDSEGQFVIGEGEQIQTVEDYESQLAGEFKTRLLDKIADICFDKEYNPIDEETCSKSFCSFHEICGRVKTQY